MNMTIERIIRDIYRIKNSEDTNKVKNDGSDKVNMLKGKTTETTETTETKKYNSTDNFMKFQWSWTL